MDKLTCGFEKISAAIQNEALANSYCLDPDERLSPGQAEEIERVYAAYPHLNDDEFVAENLDRWLA